jgi:hypothetical protein
MNCCEPYVFPFINKDVVTIPYGPAMAALYGDYPNVSVIHWDNDAGEYARPMVRIALLGTPITAIKIDNAGFATGFVKISAK